MEGRQALAALGALAQETRLRSFACWSARAGRAVGGRSSPERSALSPSSLSFHLQQLVHAGLITQRRTEPATDLRGRITPR